MSMACCMDCGEFIDTDEDPDSTYYAGGCVCESCRETTKQTPED